MEQLNFALFSLLNGPAAPSPFVLTAALLFGEWLIWLLPAAAVLAWLRSGEAMRGRLLAATATVLTGLCLNQLIGLGWQHPRPFMLHLGYTFISHVADSSFPSDHLTVIWCAACSLLLQRPTRATGIAIAVLGIPAAWGRIYLGVHFPLDMLGAALVAMCSAAIVSHLPTRATLATLHCTTRLHRAVFAPFIARGWVHD
jgi:undecaprenyl-diphosphatase